jgi:excisionase family DNA binding protein
MSRYQSPPPKPSTASSPAKTTPPGRSGRRLVSSKQAGECLGVSQNTIRKFVAEGKLPAYLIGEKLVKFDPADLDHFLASNRIDNS